MCVLAECRFSFLSLSRSEGEKRKKWRERAKKTKGKEKEKNVSFTSSTDQTGRDSACPKSASCLPRPLPSSAETQSESAERSPTRWPEASWREREEEGAWGGGGAEAEVVVPQASSAAVAAAVFKSASSEMSLYFEFFVSFVCTRS